MPWRLRRAPRAEKAIRLLRLGHWQAAGGRLAQAGAARPEAHIPMMTIPSEHSRGSFPALPNRGLDKLMW